MPYMQRTSFKSLHIIKLRPGFTDNGSKDVIRPAKAYFVFFIELLPMLYPLVCLVDVYACHTLSVARWAAFRVQRKLHLGGISTAGESACVTLQGDLASYHDHSILHH